MEKKTYKYTTAEQFLRALSNGDVRVGEAVGVDFRCPWLVDPALLTKELLCARDRGGETIAYRLHSMAGSGYLGSFIHLLTPDMLTAVHYTGESMVAVVAEFGKLKQVAGMLTSEMLMLKTRFSKRTVLSFAVGEHCLDRIQPGMFRPGMMNRKFWGRPLAQILVTGYADYVSTHLGEFHEKVRSALLARLLAA